MLQSPHLTLRLLGHAGQGTHNTDRHGNGSGGNSLKTLRGGGTWGRGGGGGGKEGAQGKEEAKGPKALLPTL